MKPMIAMAIAQKMKKKPEEMTDEEDSLEMPEEFEEDTFGMYPLDNQTDFDVKKRDFASSYMLHRSMRKR